MIMRKPTVAPSRPSGPKRQRAPRSRRVPLWPLLLATLLLAAVVGGILLTRDGGGSSADASSTKVKLTGVGAFDPDGGDGEHDDEAALATDGNPATFWRTSTYRSQLSAFKSGVGLVIEADARPKRLVVTTDTPGFTAEIKAGNSPEGPFATISESKLVGPSTTWELRQADARYYVIWITELIGSAHVNEVKPS